MKAVIAQVVYLVYLFTSSLVYLYIYLYNVYETL